MRRALEKVRLVAAAGVVVASVLLPWAWGEAKKALTQ